MKYYSLNVFKTNNIPYNWFTVYVGTKINILSIKEIGNYAIEYLSDNPSCIDPNIAELAFGAKQYDIDELVKKVIKNLYNANIEKNDVRWNLEEEKLRYVALQSLFVETQDIDKLKEAINKVCSNFSYPEELSQFACLGCRDQSIDYLDDLKNFLALERNKILQANQS